MKKVLSAVTAAVLLSSSAAAAPGDAAGNVYSTDMTT